jgi:hypothetical protein
LQFGKIYGFDERLVEARLLRAATVVLLTPAGHGHDEHVLAPRLLPDALARIVAIGSHHPSLM